MSRENVDLVVSIYGAVERRDYELPFEVADENILWDMSGMRLPDVARVYRGHDGLREFWASWLQAWDTIEFRSLSPEDLGDHVLVEVRQRNVGRGSGIPIDFHYFQIFTVENGKVVACRVEPTRAGALALVGLSE